MGFLLALMVVGAVASYLAALLIQWSSRALQRITDGHTKDNPSDAAAHITPTTSESRPSRGQPETATGPAALSYECAHDWTVTWDLGRLQTTEEMLLANVSKTGQEGWCIKCGALWSHGSILVPDAAPIPSTFPRLESPLSATSTSAPSPSFVYPIPDWSAP